MSSEIYGPFGDVMVLRSALDDATGDPIAIEDSLVLEQFLRSLLDSPGNREALREAAYGDPLMSHGPLSDEELVRLIAQRVSDGWLRLSGPGEVRMRTRGTVGAQGAQPPDAGEEEKEEREEEVKIKDWILECAHHAASGRDLFEKGTRVELVPDVGSTKDMVKVHWRDDWRGSMPPSLEVRTPGRPQGQARQSGSYPGGYTTYGLEAEYLGDVDISNPISPLFWRGFLEKTTHTIAPGPTSIPVEVYNPRQFKFEFKLPPLAGFKGGSKFEASGAQEIRALAKTGKVKKQVTTEDAYWTPSSKSLETFRTDSHPDPDFKPSESSQKLSDTISVKRDGSLVPDIDFLKMVGVVLEFADTVRGIIKMVQDYAPKVGWYIEFGLQLLQGGVSVDWYWKEHTDHRVFMFIDFATSLTLYSIKFEVGIGVSAFSFGLQVYASLEGELGLECGIKRDHPDGAPGFRLPGVKGKITGALGARIEGGYLFNFEAKGETAIEAEAQIGIYQVRAGRKAMFTIDARARWTGIKCTATGSVGALGIRWTETKNLTLVPEGPWWGLEWPSDEPYSPPTMSEAAITNVIRGVLTRGWNVLVYEDDESRRYTHDAVARYIASYVERDSAFDKVPKAVDALANAVRQDLDRLGERDWERDWVKVSDLRRYCRGSVRGLSLRAHLEDGASPTRQLAAANGGP